MVVELANGCARAEVHPALGGRVQHLVDLASGRELLYQRVAAGDAADGFLAASTGGWDEMFPNDTPWRGHPDHGRIWCTGFEVVERSAGACTLAAELAEPAVRIERRLRLLDPPRRGLRADIRVTASAPTGPFLWAAHPMLAAGPGWRVELPPGTILEADAEAPGRAVPGQRVDPPVVLPEPDLGWSEVLYASHCAEARVVSPSGEAATRVAWDGSVLAHPWVVTVTGELGIDLVVLVEPCTSRPYRLDEAIAAGSARSLAAAQTLRWWVEVEALG